ASAALFPVAAPTTTAIYTLSLHDALPIWIGYLLPLTYFNQVARGVMLKDAPLEALVLPIGLLALLGLVVFGLAVLRFRSDLAPSDRKSTRLNSSHVKISYAVFCLKKKTDT